MEKIKNSLNNLIQWITNNKALSAVSSGLGGAVGILIIGSVFSVLRQIPINAYQTFITSTGLRDIFNVPTTFTTNFIAVYAVFAIAYQYCVKEDKDGLMPGFLAEFVFFSLTPTVTGDAGTTLSMTYLGAQGLIMSIIIGIVVAKVYCLIMDKELYIHMPESVPPFVSRGFAAITPCLVLAIVIVIIRVLLASSGANLFDLIYRIIQMPLSNIAASPFAIVLAVFLTQVCWWFGIHGVSAIMVSVYMPLLYPLTLQNLEAYNAGLPIPNLFSYDTLLLSFAGGCGATLGLCIAMAFLSKSTQYKQIGRLCLIPGIFGVNEPVIFGVPIVLNPRMFLPWVVYPTLVTALGCFFTAVGIIEPYNGLHLSNIPSFITSFIYMGVRGGIFNICVIIGSFFVYWFFGVKKLDEEAYQAELAEKEEN